MSRHFHAGQALAVLACVHTLCGCLGSRASSSDLQLRRIVLYQNGIGYFERAGVIDADRLRLSFRDHEVDDVIKSLVVLEDGARAQRTKASTVTVHLPEAKAKAEQDGSTWLDVVLGPHAAKSVSIAYAVPTAAWKATYRVILADATGPPGSAARSPSPGSPTQRALLQAWALIDNVTDEDWNHVRLTLATGAPLSFASDIRAPKFVARPDANGNMVEPIARGPVVAESHDADGIPDDVDGCPDSPGVPGDDGCPEMERTAATKSRPSPGAAGKRVVVTGNDLHVLSKVVFGKGSDKIMDDARPILDEVASVLAAHPGIARVAVEGHASADERDAAALSARRAAAVIAALRERGVRAELVARAFASSRPIESDSGEAGRSKNRRAEFAIEERAGRLERIVQPEKPQTLAPHGAVLAGAAGATARAAAAPRDGAGAVRYDIDDPISIPRRSSTLVTLVNELVPGEDVYLFRPDPAVPLTAVHPLRAALLENRGVHGLRAGNVAIFAGGTFVGEGLVERVGPGETAMIPYAVDSSTRVRVSTDERVDPVRLVKLARGVMTVEDVQIQATRYEIVAGKRPARVLFVRHPRHAGFEVRALPPGTRSTNEAHIVPVLLVPGKTVELVVEARRPRRQEVTVLEPDGARLGLYLGGGLPTELERPVRELVTLRVELGKLEDGVVTLRQQTSDTAQRAAELRATLHAIEKTPRAAELQQRLLERLTQTTARGEELATKMADHTASMSELRARLLDKLRDVRLEEAKGASSKPSGEDP